MTDILNIKDDPTFDDRIVKIEIHVPPIRHNSRI